MSALIAAALAAAFLPGTWPGTRVLPAPRCELRPAALRANGFDAASLTVESDEAPRVVVDAPRGAASLERVTREGGAWNARIRAGVRPGAVRVRVAAPGRRPAAATLTLLADDSDSAGDGMPDALRLDSPRDRQAFRRWFTWLAEAQYFHDPAQRPAEIADCAALLRYAYREALHAHDAAWAAAVRAPLLPAFPPVSKYEYPYTPLGALLFRVKAGPYRAGDAAGGAFLQFADIETLARHNAHFIGRDLQRAEPGDLLFFRQRGGAMPWHGMIYLGESAIRPDGRRYVVYHTGPEGRDPGEMRRLEAEELLRFPRTEWRPLPENPQFLGVARWNILRRLDVPE